MQNDARRTRRKKFTIICEISIGLRHRISVLNAKLCLDLLLVIIALLAHSLFPA
jgi:hypothetical protein